MIIKLDSMPKNRTTPSVWQKLYRKLEIVWERVRGVDFSSVIPVVELGLNESLSTKGSPSCNKYLTQLLDSLNITPNDAILDIGCAKGAAIRCMTKFAFSRIDGVEISSVLSDIAVKNFERLKDPRVEIKNIDAGIFQSYQNYDFFYLYNPFPKEMIVRP